LSGFLLKTLCKTNRILLKLRSVKDDQNLKKSKPNLQG
jgi:hypothetical protein